MRASLVSYITLEDLREAARSSSQTFRINESVLQRLAEGDLPPLVSPHLFALILGISPKLLTAMAKFPDRYYKSFPIPKRGGGKRTITAPRVFLKTVQRYILQAILERQPIPDYVHGFVQGRSILTNARQHAKAAFLLNVDIRDFFGSVRANEVSKVFRRLGFPHTMANLLTSLCTLKDSLPQGAPTSPAIANLVFAEVDSEIHHLCAGKRVSYTRYADDMTFSANKPLTPDFLDQVRRILVRHGYEVNSKKVRFARPGQAKYVTGLVVNERVHPKREVRRLLRAIFHRAETNPQRVTDTKAVLTGWASFVNSYDPKRGKNYLQIARRFVDPHASKLGPKSKQ